jgi:undecaprenyl-diphosphatase
MEFWQTVVLGVVEGLTEYLPVSSTGHLLVTQRLLGIPSSEAANAFIIVIQAGAIAAVLSLYRERVAQMLRGLAGRDPKGLNLVRSLLAAFAPAAVIGKLLDEPIERVLFGAWPVVIAWFFGGVLLLAVAPRIKGREGLATDEIGWKAAMLVGLAQCFALWPGVSRSMATMLGGVFMGLSMAAAVEFSFLLGLLTLGAATAYKSLQSGDVLLEAYDWPVIATAVAVSWLSAVVAVKWMVGWINRHGLEVFGYWRIGVALVVGCLLVAGVIEP